MKVAASDALDKAVELARKAIAESREKTVRADSDQLDADQMFERATELMSSQEFVKAAELFQKVVEQDPENGMAWFRLGYSLHASGDLAKAIPAHKKASSFERLAAISTYNLACAYSLKKQIDKAFEALEKSIELGMDDVDQLEQDTDLDNLRDDERYAKLLKKMGG